MLSSEYIDALKNFWSSDPEVFRMIAGLMVITALAYIYSKYRKIRKAVIMCVVIAIIVGFLYYEAVNDETREGLISIIRESNIIGKISNMLD